MKLQPGFIQTGSHESYYEYIWEEWVDHYFWYSKYVRMVIAWRRGYSNYKRMESSIHYKPGTEETYAQTFIPAYFKDGKENDEKQMAVIKKNK